MAVLAREVQCTLTVCARASVYILESEQRLRNLLVAAHGCDVQSRETATSAQLPANVLTHWDAFFLVRAVRREELAHENVA